MKCLSRDHVYDVIVEFLKGNLERLRRVDQGRQQALRYTDLAQVQLRCLELALDLFRPHCHEPLPTAEDLQEAAAPWIAMASCEELFRKAISMCLANESFCSFAPLVITVAIAAILRRDEPGGCLGAAEVEALAQTMIPYRARLAATHLEN